MTFFVQRAGDEFFARAGLAVNADAGFAGCNALDLGHDAAHGLAREDERMLADARAQVTIFCFEARKS